MRQKVSMINELKTLHERNTWEPVLWNSLSADQRGGVIRSFLFLKDKYLADGTFEKLKSRLVGGGHMQDRELYGNVASPTGSIVSLFIIAIISVHEKRCVSTADIGSAYINADMDDEVFMRIDKECTGILTELFPTYISYVNHDGGLVVRLKKALYGCIQSAKLWYNELSSFLVSLGFVVNPYDECVFNQAYSDGQCTVFIYVDDLFMTCNSQKVIDNLLDALQVKYLEVKRNHGTSHNYLGMTFIFSEGYVQVGMEAIVEETIKGMDIVGNATSPAGNNLFNVKSDGILLTTNMKESFHSVIAKLLYIAKRVRPDILTAVSFLTTRIQYPTDEDWCKLLRVLRYLNSTLKLGLILGSKSCVSISAFVDASYGVHADGKSHTGFGMSWGRGFFLARSGKQKIVTKSSTEAELVAVSDECSTVIGVRNFICSQGHSELGPVLLHQDNRSTMSIIGTGKFTGRNTKHVNVRYFFIKDRVNGGDVELRYLTTEDMIADALTKPLQGALFRKHRDHMLGHLTSVECMK